jgi:hypothetical protein
MPLLHVLFPCVIYAGCSPPQGMKVGAGGFFSALQTSGRKKTP